MKDQATGDIRAHFVRCALWLLLPLVLGTIPLALAQRVIIKPSGSATAQSRSSMLPRGCGLAWRIVNSPNSSANSNILFGVGATSSSNVWAAGVYYDQDFFPQTLILHWDGSAWTVSSSPNPGSNGNQINAIAALDADNAWAVGFFIDADGVAHTLVEHWDGVSWRVVPSPDQSSNPSHLVGVAALATNNVWAVGYYLDQGFVSQTLVEHWDGVSWTIVPSPSRGEDGTQLYSVAAVSPSDIWAVGYSGQVGFEITLTEHWDGSTWSIVGSPNPGAAGNYLQGVTVIAGDVWAVGYYYVSGHPRTLIERWNGNNWNVVSSPNVGTIGDSLSGVSGAAPNDVWAVGAYNLNNQTGTLQTLIEHWDGNNWTVASSPNEGTADNILYGVTAITSGEAWSGGSWSDGINGRTLALHYNDPCATPTPTPSPSSTPTTTPTPTPTPTPTATPTPCTGRCTPTPRPRPTPAPRP